jgi:ABC-type multidrug transport system ATPase subunit
MNSAILTQSLSKTFGQTLAVDRLGLAVPEGAIYALVGANGAGKTTVIKLLMNIFRPTAGSAQVLGIDSRSLAGKAFNRIGYVSENQDMPEWMTVGALLARLSSASHRPRRAVLRPRSTGPRRAHRRPHRARTRNHHLSLLARPRRNRKLLQPHRLSRTGPPALF